MQPGPTAVALLDAAEVAFAERGVEKVSLRAIMRSAGANPNAVHYHFGSRRDLERAVLDRILEPLQRRRLELLDALVAADPEPPVAALVEAIVRPDYEAMLDVGDRNPDGARVVGALYCRPPDHVRALVEASFAPVADRFQPHLVAAVPHVDPDELAWRVRWSIFAVVGALLSDPSTVITRDTLDAGVARLVAVAVGALIAPSLPQEDPK